MQGLTWTNATRIPLARPGTGTLGSDTIIGLSRGFALYNQSLPSKTRLVIPAETGPIFSDDHVSVAATRVTCFLFLLHPIILPQKCVLA